MTSWMVRVGVVVAVFPVCAAAPTVHAVLTDALLCRVDSAKTVHDLVKGGSDFSKGFAVHGFGDGTGHKSVVVLASPLRIGTSETCAVVAEGEASNFDFGAFTYGEFTGDFKAVVAQLKLQPAKSKESRYLGQFVSREAPANACPPTIALTPLDGGKFLLGCGWCNGG